MMHSNIIRGEGVFFHYASMIRNISKVLFLVIALTFLSVVSYSFYERTTSENWDDAKAYFWATVFEWDKDKEITYPVKIKGKEVKVKTKIILEDRYIKKSVKKIEDTFYNSILLSAILSFVSCGFVIFYFHKQGGNIKKIKKIRGIFLTTSKLLKAQILKHNKYFKHCLPYNIADFEYPINGNISSTDHFTAGEQSHTLIVGATGSGKTRILFDLVEQLRIEKQKAIIIDIKGDYIKHFYDPAKGDVILNPLDARGASWSIFKETTPIKGFSTIAKSLLPKEGKGDPIWIDASRAVVSEMAIMYSQSNLSMAEFADKILTLKLPTLIKLLEKTGASKIINQDIEKAAMSVLMTLTTYLRPLKLYRGKDSYKAQGKSGNEFIKLNNDDAVDQNTQDSGIPDPDTEIEVKANYTDSIFSITDWVDDITQKNFIFISSKADVKEDLNPLISTQVAIAANAIRAIREESMIPKIWFILDELQYFEQPIAPLIDSLATARSSGAVFVLGAQDISSLARIYTDKGAHSIANNCKTKIFMNVEGTETANWCSASLGEGEVEELVESISYGGSGRGNRSNGGVQASVKNSTVIAVTPAEMMMLKFGCGYIKFSGYEPASFKFGTKTFATIAKPYCENIELYNQFKDDMQRANELRAEIENKLSQDSSREALINEIENCKSDIEENSLSSLSDVRKKIESDIQFPKTVADSIESM